MTCYIVVESKSDILYVRELLKPEFALERDDIRLVSAGERSSADAKARSLLAFASPADDAGLECQLFRRAEYSYARRNSGGRDGQVAIRSRWRILLAVPSIEALLFSDRNLLRRLSTRAYGGTFHTRQYVPPANPDASHASGLADEFTQALESRLAQLDFSALQQHPFACQLKMFVGEMLQKSRSLSLGETIMPVPYRKLPRAAQEGIAAFVEVQRSRTARQLVGALLLIDGRGQPLEFVHNVVDAPGGFLWAGREGSGGGYGCAGTFPL